MNRLPDPNVRQPHPTQAGQPTDADRDNIRRLMAALDEIDVVQPTAVRVGDPTIPSWKDGPRIGDTPTVPQPGRPAMSQKATDDSVRMLTAGWLTLCAGGATSAVLHYSAQADPTTVALVAAIPASLAIPVLALSRLVKRVKETVETTPAEQHHHYTGTVIQDHRTTNTTTRGIWATTHNQLPPSNR